MPETLEEARAKLIYDESVRKMTEQQSVLNSLHTRTGVLLASASIASTFLGGQAFEHGYFRLERACACRFGGPRVGHHREDPRSAHGLVFCSRCKQAARDIRRCGGRPEHRRALYRGGSNESDELGEQRHEIPPTHVRLVPCRFCCAAR
jgi:hypothetical protein